MPISRKLSLYDTPLFFGFPSLPGPLVYLPIWFLFFLLLLCFLITIPACSLCIMITQIFGLDLDSVFDYYFACRFVLRISACLVTISAWINNDFCVCPGLHLAPYSDVTWYAFPALRPYIDRCVPVQSNEFSTGGLQSRHKNISKMIKRNGRHLS